MPALSLVLLISRPGADARAGENFLAREVAESRGSGTKPIGRFTQGHDWATLGT
jgi:hypothetical protein